MPRLFDSIKLTRPRLNKFDLSHERKMSFDMGQLIPCYIQDVVPGDKFRVSSEVFMRLAPLLAPMMHRVNVYVHYFFVPNRLVWDEWEDFITGGRLGTSAPVAPYFMTNEATTLAQGNLQNGTLADFLGVPHVSDGVNVNPIKISALPFRGYQAIWNEYFLDQNLSGGLDFLKTSGAMTGSTLQDILWTRTRCWEKDYFTSALPWAQRSGAPVSIPFDDDTTVQTKAYRTSTGLPYSQAGDMTIGNTGNVLMTGSASEDGGTHIGAEGHGINVNDLRRSIRLQEWLEKNARGGARYIEQILSHFGVKSSDARLQRPEYLGGGKTPVQVSEVLSTMQQFDANDDPIGTPQGDPTGRGMSIGNANGFSKRFEEHGYVFGIMSVLPRTAYQQGVPRHLSRFDKMEYYWPEFANIGEQEILKKEIFYNMAGQSDPEGTWGYQSRYSEYKYGCSTVHGEFRDTLSYWHMGRIFGAHPPLNEAFVTANPTDRIWAVTGQTDYADHLWVQLYNKVDALRPMPYFGTPIL